MNPGLKNGNKSIYSFAEFELDLGKGVLLRDGKPISLQWKSLEVLCELISSRGDLITREELIERVWPDSFVEENNLSQHIRALRKALGDGENGNRFIETVPRKGFRFLPPVEEVSFCQPPKNAQAIQEPTLDPPPWDNSPSTKTMPRLRPGFGTGIALLLLAAALAAAFFVWTKKASSAEKRIRYANQIRLAAQALESGNLILAKQMIDGTRPLPGAEDLRGFEWGYLSQIYDDTISSQPITLDHPGWVEGVAFSPDDKMLASADTDGTVRLWSTVTGEHIKSFRGHSGWVWTVAFSPDGKRLLSSGADKKVILWEVETGRHIFSAGGDMEPLSGPVFSPDGKTIFASGIGAVRTMDSATGRQTRADFQVGAGDLFPAVSPDAKLIAVRGSGLTALVIDAVTGRRITELQGHSGWMIDLEFSPDSTRLLTGSVDGTAKLWYVPTGQELFTFLGHEGETYDVAYSPDGDLIATGNTDNTVKIWDAKKGYLISTLKGHSGRVSALVFSTDGNKIASGSSDKTVRIWNVPKTGDRGLLKGPQRSVKGINFSFDGELIASADENRVAVVWDVETERERQIFPWHSDVVNSVEFSRDGTRVLTASNDGKVSVWERTTGRSLYTFDSKKGGTVAYFAPNAEVIATTHFFSAEEVQLWDASTQKLRCSFDPGGAWNLQFSPDGTRVTVSSTKGGVRLWDTGTCRVIWSFNGNPESEYASMFWPNGRILALEVLNNGRSLKLFDTDSGREISWIGGHEAEMTSVELSPDGKRLVTSAKDSTVKIWDPLTGQELLSLKADIGEVNSVKFSPKGENLAAGGTKGQIRLWRGVDR